MGRKKKHEILQVLLDGDVVGQLIRSRLGFLEFRYATTWLDSDRTMAISWGLPLREEPYRAEPVQACFENLLPDSDRIRQAIARRLGLGSHEPFELLAALGKDCVGALQFVPEGVPIEFSEAVVGEPVGETEIARMLRNLGSIPLGLDAGQEFRISIAGVQEKTALLRWKDDWYRPRGTTPTTHILKPPLGRIATGLDFPASVENEWLCLRLAAHFGLPVTAAERLRFEDVSCLGVERFDRAWSADRQRLRRVPQEDLCQALGYPSSRKYQSEGGPGMKAIMRFLDSSDARDEDRRMFMRAQLVFFLLGATDGHAKNFSIFLSRDGFRLTPLYDVMTIEPLIAASRLEEKEARLSMFVGDNRHYRLKDIKRHHWNQTARICAFAGVDELMDDLLERCAQVERFARELSVDGKLLEAVIRGVGRRAAVLKSCAGQ